MNKVKDNKELLALKNISHIYNQDNQKIKVLNNVTLNVLKGEMVSLIGPSGTGKSTLLNIAGLLENPTTGSVNLGGYNCTELNEDNKTKFRGSKIGFVFQSHRLFQEFSAVENVMLPQLIMGKPKINAEKKAKELLSALGLERRLDFRPAKLSGGEAQRVAIARALISETDLILADEPTGNLDYKTSEDIFSYFLKLKKLKKTIIFATHNRELANRADYKLFISNGDIKRVNARK